MEKWSPEWKAAELETLREEWADCKLCELHEDRLNVVFGEGNPDADILFVGEAPGEDEDDEGIPMVGRGGSLFTAFLLMAGLQREDVYIANILGCHPPKNRDPKKEEKIRCSSRLYNIIYLVDPLLIVPIGKVALKALAGGRDWGIMENRGKLFSSPHPKFRVTGDRNCAPISGLVFPRVDDDKKKHILEYDMIPIVHPAFILRTDSFDEKKQEFEQGGWADRTVDDLRHIAEFVKNLKQEYERYPRFI